VSIRHASNVFRLSAATMFTLLISSAVQAQPSTGEYDCVYRGTAPVCAGKCLRGEVERGRGKGIEGDICLTGTKVLCCKISSRSQPPEKSPAERVNQPKGSGTLKEKTTAAVPVKQPKGAGPLKVLDSTAGEKERKRPIPINR
jgi:hypothetical protein